MSGARVLFLDRDGTLIVEPPADKQVDRLDKVALIPGVIPALLSLRDAGFSLVMVTNQDGLGTPSFPEERFRECQEFVLRLFASQGIVFDEVFVCPHLPVDVCACRKPKLGLVEGYLARTPIDPRRSAVVGDRETDMELARKLGIEGILIGEAPALSWAAASARIMSKLRSASVRRTTKETAIEVEVALDVPGPIEVHTGIGFFDHMLEQIAKHGGFSLKLRCQGDLHIDEHHTVEDTALALGQALREALGDKRGIGRYGFVLPMDEALAQVSIDLAGRPYAVFEGTLGRDTVGQLPTELVPHFFRSLADTLGAAVHVQVTGSNTHHMIEGCFKGMGRALRMAIAKEGSELPSSKGVL